MNINFNNKKIVKIYGGGQVLWEMPECKVGIKNANAGTNILQINVSPYNAKINWQIKRKDNTISGTDETNNIERTIYLKDKLESDDYITIVASCEGFKKVKTVTMVY